MTRSAPRGGIGSYFPAYWGAPGDGSWTPEGWHWVVSGRAALALAATQLTASSPRPRIWVPDYYCWDVTDYLRQRLEVVVYESSPVRQRLPEDTAPGDVLLIPSYFGRRPPPPGPTHGPVILDVTHDPLAPWIDGYPADAVVGSLRKTLPLPEGGFMMLRSPQRPQLASDELPRTAVAAAAEAMSLKLHWIHGKGQVGPEVWYPLLRHHEELISEFEPSGVQPATVRAAKRLPAAEMRLARLRNLSFVEDRLAGALPAGMSTLDNSYGLIVLVQSPVLRDELRTRLIAAEIFPAVLWALPPAASVDSRAFADRMLMLHTDYRYGRNDMEYLVEQVVTALA